jgi:hypothetical protein
LQIRRCRQREPRKQERESGNSASFLKSLADVLLDAENPKSCKSSTDTRAL